MAHSPGPWAAYPPECSANECWTIQSDGGFTAFVCGGDTTENSKAAALIAAAPEMLAACELALECMAECFCDDAGTGPGTCDRCVVEAAVRKAKGG